MSALPPDDVRNLQHSAFAARHPLAAMEARWAEIEHSIAALAALAELAPGEFLTPAPMLADALERADDWQRELAWQGIEDIEALMHPGMTALDVLSARGQDARVPALTLWRELDAARRSVLMVLGAA